MIIPIIGSEKEAMTKTRSTVEVELLEGIEKCILAGIATEQGEGASAGVMIDNMIGVRKIEVDNEIKAPHRAQAILRANGSAAKIMMG